MSLTACLQVAWLNNDILIQGSTFLDQVTGDILKYDYDNKFFISLDDRDNNTAEKLQNFLDNKNLNWYRVTAPYWS